SGAATVRVLGEMTAVPAEEAAWFLEWFGPGRAAPLEERVRAVLDSPLPEARAAEGGDAGDGCAAGAPLLGEDPLRREVVALAARARARGMALEQAERLAGATGRSWLARQLDGTLWSPVPVDSATAALVEPLARRVEELDRGPDLPAAGRSPFVLPAPRCGAGLPSA
ncbi:MAG TPA: hypothetical protein VF263_11425, partial [Longimicrobiaceae bacterium]